jgi:hypothetical protein
MEESVLSEEDHDKPQETVSQNDNTNSCFK